MLFYILLVISVVLGFGSIKGYLMTRSIFFKSDNYREEYLESYDNFFAFISGATVFLSITLLSLLTHKFLISFYLFFSIFFFIYGFVISLVVKRIYGDLSKFCDEKKDSLYCFFIAT